MLVFIDFDDVLFNTKRFKDDLQAVFRDHGVSNDLYIKYYYDPNDTRTVKAYDPRAQIKRICEGEGICDSSLLEATENFLQNQTSQYIFTDVHDFIGSLKNATAVILSFGEKRMQQEKISKSGIMEICPQVIITDTLKSSAIEDFLSQYGILRESEMFIIDDRVEQISDIKKHFPNMKSVWIKRPEGRYQEQQMQPCCDYAVANLNEVRDIINQVMVKNQ